MKPWYDFTYSRTSIDRLFNSRTSTGIAAHQFFSLSLSLSLTAPDDYTALTTDLSFIGNQTHEVIVNITIDPLLEFDETFFGRLELVSTQLNVSVAPSQATATIQDTSG